MVCYGHILAYYDILLSMFSLFFGRILFAAVPVRTVVSQMTDKLTHRPLVSPTFDLVHITEGLL